jgi:hypothetical protein
MHCVLYKHINPLTLTSSTAFRFAEDLWKRHFRHQTHLSRALFDDPLLEQEYHHESQYYIETWKDHLKRAKRKKSMKNYGVGAAPVFIAESREGSSRCDRIPVQMARHEQWKWMQRAYLKAARQIASTKTVVKAKTATGRVSFLSRLVFLYRSLYLYP